MDLWRWIHGTTKALRRDGQERLAALIDDIPTWVCDDEHPRVEALLPEALALARAARLPWVEVYLRHWALQSRVLHRYEAREHLGEAVALLEFASRDECRGCPQSVCVTQDLAACYGCADGPGYVDERLAVAAETLARIDPTWPCFECISEEYASALEDGDRHEEALAWAQRQTDASIAAGLRSPPRFERQRARSLLALGRAEAAWSLLEDHEAEAVGGAGREVEVDLIKARVLGALGRVDEARALLPEYERVIDTPSHYHDWAFASLLLCAGDRGLNDAALGVRLRRMLVQAEANGAIYLAGELAMIGARLAADRGAWTLARHALADLDRIVGQLRRPAGLLEAIADRRPTIERGPEAAPRLPEAPEGVRESIPDDAEAALDALVAAAARWPDHVDVAILHARALAGCGLEDAAERALRSLLDRRPDAEALRVELARTLLAAGRHDALERLAAGAGDEGVRAQVLWLLATSDERRGELEAATRRLEAILEIDPEAAAPRHRVALLERRRGRHAEALAHLEHLVARSDPGDADWDRMTQAAILGRWELVRASARRLGLEFVGLEGEGPIDARFGLCRVRVADEGGPREVYAERRSPVTARVIQMSGPGEVERYRDLVAFDAARLDDPAAPREEGDDDDDDAPRVPIFAAVEVIEPGGRKTWALDGVHPGAEAWEALDVALAALGGEVVVRSDERYRVDDPEDEVGDDLPGVFAWACVPASIEPEALHERLTALTSGWAHPIVWPELASALPPGERRRRAMARVEEVTERYGL
ncbi:MAG: hypothetical protein R3B09_13235 [Nannocystaceae bacterium]